MTHQLANAGVPLFPERASAEAWDIDVLYFALIGLSVFILLLLFGLMLTYLVRYRAGSRADRSDQLRKTWHLETTWISAATLAGIVLFVWGGKIYLDLNTAPPDAVTYYVVGKQWMWTMQHPTGRREINELHLPVDQPVKIVLTSEDVIHSFYVPAFRVKRDALPNRYTSLWFTPTKPGRFHLFCAEYCGADHARMIGEVIVMEPDDYATWLEQHPAPPTAQPLAFSGELSFRTLGCNQCHRPDTDALAPYLEGLFGSTVTLRDGSTVVADEQYIRESILDPAAKVVRGYQPIMPTYAGMLDELQIAQIVAAVRGLEHSQPTERAEDAE